MKKILAMALTLVTSFSLVACGSGETTTTQTNTAEESTEETAEAEEGTEEAAEEATEAAVATSALGIDEQAVIGVLVSDATSSEALAFRSYYEDYIAAEYNVELVYSDELTDAEGETSAIETFINQGVQAVISLSSFDRPGQIELCEDAGIYYAIAAGTLTEEEYGTYKDYEHYVGSVGPSLATEYQTGYDMAKNYTEQGDTNFLIFGGAAAFGTDMHIYRVAGMLAAICDADTTGATTYDGATGEDIVAALAGTSMDPSKFASETYSVDYMDGYNMDDAWFGLIAEKLAAPDLQVVLAVGNGSDFFGSMIPDGSIKVASVDCFTEDYGKAIDASQLDWMAGKFNASIGPVFVATLNAINGAPIRTAEGSAFMLDQGYWEAAGADAFKNCLSAVSDPTAPVYTKEILDQYVATTEKGVTYDDFAAFVGAYTFDEVTALK